MAQSSGSNRPKSSLTSKTRIRESHKFSSGKAMENYDSSEDPRMFL